MPGNDISTVSVSSCDDCVTVAAAVISTAAIKAHSLLFIAPKNSTNQLTVNFSTRASADSVLLSHAPVAISI